MKKLLFPLYALLWLSTALALEPWQGSDVEVESWRCGAPLVLELRKNDPDKKLLDPSGQYKLKESLEKISISNLKYVKDQLGKLSEKEKQLKDLIETKYHVPIVHRTSVKVAKLMLKNKLPLSSPVKRGVDARVTPGIEQRLYAGWDCIYASVSPPYGIQNYGTVIVHLKNNINFAWGSIYTGFSWTREVARRSISDPATGWMKTKFSRQVYTNNHFDEAIALQIISNIRSGSTIRGKGQTYDKSTIIKTLLDIDRADRFWRKVNIHRLGYLEAHYTDDLALKDIEFVQFRTMDMDTVRSWSLNPTWFEGAYHGFIQHYNRSE